MFIKKWKPYILLVDHRVAIQNKKAKAKWGIWEKEILDFMIILLNFWTAKTGLSLKYRQCIHPYSVNIAKEDILRKIPTNTEEFQHKKGQILSNQSLPRNVLNQS